MTKLVTAIVRPILLELKAIPVVQKAIRSKRRGCMDALWTECVVASEATADRQSMAVAWVDYSKAFDRVPHRWIRVALKTTGVSGDVSKD